jgi:cytochrome c553
MRRLLPFSVALTVASGLAFGSLVPGCSDDPVQSDAIAALGKEKGPVNETHRAGQPCGLCHQAHGEAGSDFSVAGTVFASLDSLVGVEGARIDLVDANKTSPPSGTPVLTNCVGNFFLRRSEWDPAFPIAVRVSKGGASRTMQTQVSQAASCATCHEARLPPTDRATKVPQIYIFGPEGDPNGKAKTCDRDPDLFKQ